MTVQIIAVIDKSGSMKSKRADVIGGFNTFLEEQLKLGEDAEITVVLFNDHYEMVSYREPLKNALPLTEETYVPGGSTALLDTLGKIISQFEIIQKEQKDVTQGVIVTIITDGEDNTSREYDLKHIKALISRMESMYNWKFVFMGANQDSFTTASMLGITQAMNFSDNGVGVRSAYTFMSASTASYRASVGNIDHNPKLLEDRNNEST